MQGFFSHAVSTLTCNIKSPPYCSGQTASLVVSYLLWQVHSKSLAIVTKWVTCCPWQGGWRLGSLFVPFERKSNTASTNFNLTLQWRRQMTFSAGARCWLIIRLEFSTILTFFVSRKNNLLNEAFEIAAHLWPSLPSSPPTSLCTSTLSKEYIRG